MVAVQKASICPSKSGAVCQLPHTRKHSPYISSWAPTCSCLPGRKESTCTWNCVWERWCKLYLSPTDNNWKDAKHTPIGEQINQRYGTHQCNRKLLTNTKELTLTTSSSMGELETLKRQPAEGASYCVVPSIYKQQIYRERKWFYLSGAGVKKGQSMRGMEKLPKTTRHSLMIVWMFSLNGILYITLFSIYKIANHSPREC